MCLNRPASFEKVHIPTCFQENNLLTLQKSMLKMYLKFNTDVILCRGL